MAKGGKRTYARDGNGRFASTPGSAAKKAAKSTSGRASTLGARTGLKGSKAKLRAKDKADQTLQNTLSTRAQKGAVKRGSRKLAAAKTAAQARIGGGRKGVIGMPKGMKNRQLAGRIDGPVKTASGSTKRALKRTGKTLKIAVKKAPKPSKEDRSIDKVRNLKIATEMGRLGGFGSMKFIPDKQMTPSRRKALGIKPFSDDAESQRFRVSRQTVGPVSGVLISEKSSYLAKVPKKRQGVIRQERKPVAVARAARKPSTAPAPKPPTRTKGSKASLPRTPGTVAKPKGLKPKKKEIASNATVAKSIKPGAGKAPKRISFLLAYHGTNKESAAAIRAGGYKETQYGTYGAGVYATTSRKAAREYANWRAAGGKNKFGEAFPASALGPAVLTHRIPKTRVNRNDTREAFNNMAPREWVQSGRARKLSKEWTNHFPYVVMNEQLANSTLVNRSGTIRRPRKPRRKPKP